MAYLAPDKTAQQIKIWELLANGDEAALKQIEDLREAMGDIMTRPITKKEFDYLMMRMAYLRVWHTGAFEIKEDSEGGGQELDLDGLSEHYRVVDFGACVVLSPRELYSALRTYGHGVQSMRVLMKYVHQLGWDVELTGYSRLVRAAWYEVEKLNLDAKHQIKVANYPK